MIILALLVLVFLYGLLIWKAAKLYPILYLFAFAYFVQYIFSAYLIYYEYPESLGRLMAIQPAEYFSFAIPAIVALFSGVFLFNRDLNVHDSLKKIDPITAARCGYLLLSISYLFDFLHYTGIQSLDSIHSFTTYLKYIGAFCFLFGKPGFQYTIIALVWIQLFSTVLQSSVFIDFFVWSAHLFFMILLAFKTPLWFRSLFIVLAVSGLVVVQGVKESYREKIRDEGKGGMQAFFEALTDGELVSDRPIFQSKAVTRTVGRLTEGWHLGLTLKHVPEEVSYQNGKEFFSDVFFSFVPRVFLPDKKITGTQAKFYRYTGYRVPGKLSMSIGILGDFYINFGWVGSWIGLFIFGALVAKSLHFFILRFVVPDPVNIVWVPFILTYLIRANNDFYIFFNALVKGFALFLIVNLIRRQFLMRKEPPVPSNNAVLKNRILIFYSHFSPAFKAGGPIQSLVNLVDHLKNEYKVHVFCSARDMGESNVLQGINPGIWNDYNSAARVFYSSGIRGKSVMRIFQESAPDIVYINGLYLPYYNWLPLILARIKRKRVLLAPRGMLQQGALAIKPFKKKVFIKALRNSGLCRGITWHATDQQEKRDIEKFFGRKAEVRIASNIPKAPRPALPLRNKQAGQLRLVFLSLITEKKNLILVLRALKEIKVSVVFDIYGPVIDRGYWADCKKLITGQIHQINYKGEVAPMKVQAVFSEYHAFILPTRGENFGHAIFEAFGVGVPALLSPFTPWGRLEDHKAGVTIETFDVGVWAQAIQTFLDLDQDEYAAYVNGAYVLAKEYFDKNDFGAQYRLLFS